MEDGRVSKEVYIYNLISDDTNKNGKTSKDQIKKIRGDFELKIKNYAPEINAKKIKQADLLKQTQLTYQQYELLAKDKENMDNIVTHENKNGEYKFYIWNTIRETTSYQNKAFNYQKLYDNNRLMNCVINGKHLVTGIFQMTQIAVRLLGLRTPMIRGVNGEYTIRGSTLYQTREGCGIEALL